MLHKIDKKHLDSEVARTTTIKIKRIISKEHFDPEILEDKTKKQINSLKNNKVVN